MKSAALARRAASVLLLAASALGAAAAGPIAATDDLGRSVTLKSPAQRIVTLAPFLTELVFAAGAGARVVAVSAHSDYPPAARSLPQVATAVHFSLEQVVALKPDLVLAWRDSVRREDVERMEGLGTAVYVAQARRLEDIPRLLAAIGTLVSRDVSAVIADYDAKLSRLRRTYAARPPVEVFLEIWHRPVTTIAGAHFMNDALEICRAENVFRDLAGVAPQVSLETIYRRNPQVIVGVGSAANEAEFRANWASAGSLDAVRNGRLVFVAPDTLQRPTVRMPEGIAMLCAAIDRVRPSGSTR